MSRTCHHARWRRAAWLALLLTTGCASAPPPEDEVAGDGAGAAGMAGSAAAAGEPTAGEPDPEAGTGGVTAAPPAAGSDGPPAPGADESDDVFGQEVPRSESFWVDAGRIHQGSTELPLYGLNWFGLETTTLALHGPAEARRGVREFITQVQELGFNALRVPLSPQTIRPGNATASWAVRGELDTGLEQLEELGQAAVDAGIYLLLDVHTCAASAGFRAGAPDDPACGGYSEDDWLADLTELARLAEGWAPWVVGIDIFNEPHALDWGRWREVAARGGEAVLRQNPRILVFVGGIGSEGYGGSDWPFWGENLTLALADPIDLPASRIVYAPHVYGPSVASQPYFEAGTFPRNMPGIWDEHFGFLMGSEQALVLTEFGGRYEGDDRTWQDALVDYLQERRPAGFFYWALNPNSGDTGGLLLSDWRSVNEDKLALLQRLMNP